MKRDLTARRRGWAFFSGLNAGRREWHPVLEPEQVRPLELRLADAAEQQLATDRREPPPPAP